MANPDFYLCDICGERVHKDGRLWVAIGTSPCAAGGPSEEDREPVDLCDRHKASAISALLDNFLRHGSDYDRGKAFVAWVKEQIGTRKKAAQ